MLRHINDTYSSLQGNLKGVIHELSAELSLNPHKAEKFADKLLQLVANNQQDNVKNAKHLVDHLVAVGKRSVKLEKHVDKAMLKEAKEEKKAMVEDKKEGINAAAPLEEKHADVAPHDPSKHAKGGDKPAGGDEDDPLKEMLSGFFLTFEDFEKEFQGEARTKMKEGNPVYNQITALYAKIQAEDSPLTEEEIQVELDKIDLASIGAALGSGRVLPVADIVEEVALIPKIPHKKLRQLEEKWKKGEVDSVDVFEQLQELHKKNVVPSGWLQMGVGQEEKEEEEAMANMEDEEEPSTETV